MAKQPRAYQVYVQGWVTVLRADNGEDAKSVAERGMFYHLQEEFGAFFLSEPLRAGRVRRAPDMDQFAFSEDEDLTVREVDKRYFGES